MTAIVCLILIGVLLFLAFVCLRAGADYLKRIQAIEQHRRQQDARIVEQPWRVVDTTLPRPERGSRGRRQTNR